MRMWLDYFPEGEIHGMDCWKNNPEVKEPTLEGLKHERLTIHVGDQSSKDDLRVLIDATLGGFDVIIDDGSHIAEDEQFTLGMLFPHLRPGGHYFIEDLHTVREPNPRFGVVAKSTIHVLNSFNRNGRIESAVISSERCCYLEESIGSCAIYRGGKLCAIRKAGQD